jgi:hypothetical protein
MSKEQLKAAKGVDSLTDHVAESEDSNLQNGLLALESSEGAKSVK